MRADGVAVLRAGVLTALGLATWSAGWPTAPPHRNRGRADAGRRGRRRPAGAPATHDALTGLPNRALLHARLASRSRPTAPRSALLLLDLDRFKEVNDTLGHRSATLLLAQVGARLRPRRAPSDIVARLGGDEFAVLLPRRDEAAARSTAARAARGAARAVLSSTRRCIAVDASIGIALRPEHGDDATTLLRHADVAMYAAKAPAGRAARSTTPATRPHAADRLALLAELRARDRPRRARRCTTSRRSTSRPARRRRRGAGALAAPAAAASSRPTSSSRSPSRPG